MALVELWCVFFVFPWNCMNYSIFLLMPSEFLLKESKIASVMYLVVSSI